MRSLIPVDFAALGIAEWVWLLLALGGLSLAARGTTWRLAAALAAGGLTALFGVVRLYAGAAGEGSWDRYGPILVAPAFAAAVVLLGRARPWLEALLGPRLGPLWAGALAVLSVAAQPFGVARPAEWLFLAFLGLFLVALLDRASAVHALLGRRLAGPVPVWAAAAAAFLALAAVAEPFGLTWLSALVVLFLASLVHAVLVQGRPMRRFVLRRLVGAPLVLVLLLILSFVIIKLAPGSPFDKDKRIDPEIKELLETQYGLNDPLPVQFGKYMTGLLWSGDLGKSMKQKGRSVNEIIRNHAPASARLGHAAMALALLLGLTSGLVSGIRQNSVFDYASMTGAMIGLAVPTFVVGPLLVLVFSMKLGWFRVAGWQEFPRDLVLPAITLSLPFAARVARLTRAGMLEIVNQDYVRTARAKGLSEPMIVLRHTLKGAVLPVVTYMGPAVAQLLTGTLVVEMIFGVPGLGVEFVQSALNRDYPLALGLVVLFGSLLIGFNLVVDIAYGFLDPRIRHG